MIDERLTTDIHIQLTPSLRQQIDDLARAEALKPATVARRLILAGLAAQKANDVEPGGCAGPGCGDRGAAGTGCGDRQITDC